ncbi:hypothetical protein GGF31_000767 [Allomyces arbusculus]|nr:hypothetical protein GGF31_000767 [Allomyces arbusculus]
MKRGYRDHDDEDDTTGSLPPPTSSAAVPPKSPKSPLLKHPRLHSPRVSSPLRMPPLRAATPESPTRSPASRTPSRTPMRRGAARDDENGDNDDTASRATASSSGVTRGILRRPDSAPEAADRRKSLGRRVSFARAARVKMFEKDPNAKAVPEPDPSARFYDDDEEDEDDDDNCPYDEPDFPATYRRSSGPHAFAPFVEEDIDPQPDSAADHHDDQHHHDAHPHHPHPHDSSMETSDAGDTSFEVPVKGNDSLDTTTAPTHDDSDATASSLGSLGHLDSAGDAPPRAANDEMDSWPAPTTPGSEPSTWPSMIAASGRRNDAALTFPVSPIRAPDAPPAPAMDDDEVSTANLTATVPASVAGQDEHAAAQHEFGLDDGLTGLISHELSSAESPAPLRLYPSLDDMEAGREDDALARYLAQVAPSSSSARASPATAQIARGIVDDDENDDKTTTLPRRVMTPSPTPAAPSAPTPTFTSPPAPATTAWTPGLSTPGNGGGETTSLLDLYGGIASPTAPRATPPSRSAAPSPLTLLDAFSPPRDRNPFLSTISERTEPISTSPKDAMAGAGGVEASPLMKRLHAAADPEPESPLGGGARLRSERAEEMEVDGEVAAQLASGALDVPIAEEAQPMDTDADRPPSASGSTPDTPLPPPPPADAQPMDVDSDERPASPSFTADPAAPPLAMPATSPDVPMTPIGSLPGSSSPALIDHGLVSPPPIVHPPPPANEARSPSPEAESSLLDLFPPLESCSSETVPPQAQDKEPTAEVRQQQQQQSASHERTPEAVVAVPSEPTPEAIAPAPAALAHATPSSTPPPPPPAAVPADPIAAPEKSDLDSMFELLERQLREASREMTEATKRNLEVLADSPVRQERYARPASAMRIGTPTMEPPAKRRRIASSPAISSPLARTPRRGTPTPRRMTPMRTPVQGLGDVRVTPLSSRVNRLLNRKSLAMSPTQPPEGEEEEEEETRIGEDWIGDGGVGHLGDEEIFGNDGRDEPEYGDDDELATPSRPRRRPGSRSTATRASPFPAVTDPDESVAFGDDHDENDDLMDVNLDLVEDLEHDDPRAPLHALNTLDDVLRDCGVDGFVETPVPDLPLTRRIATDLYPALVVHLPELDVHHTMCADLVDRINEIDESNAAQLAEAEGTVPAFVRRYREAVEMGDDEERMELAEKARMTATGARRFALHAYSQAWAGQVQGLVATYQASREALVQDNAVLDEHVRALSEAKSVLQDALEEEVEARRKLRAEHEAHMARLNGEVRAAREELESIRARRLDVERRCQQIRDESRALETQVHTQQIRAQNLQRRIADVDREAHQYTFFTIDDWKRVRDECDLITALTGWTVDVVAPVADVRDPVPVADLLERAAAQRGTRLVFTYRSTLRVEYDVKGGDWTLRSVAAAVGTDPSPARAYPGPAPRCSAHLVFTDHQLLTHAAGLIMDRLARHKHLTCNVHTAMRWVATRWDAWLLLAHNVYALGVAMACTVLIEQPTPGGGNTAQSSVVSEKWHEMDTTSARVRVTVALAEPEKYKVDLHWVVDLWTVVAPVVGNVRVLRGTPFELEPVFGHVDPQVVWEAVNDPEIVPGDFIAMARAAIAAARRCNGVAA